MVIEELNKFLKKFIIYFSINGKFSKFNKFRTWQNSPLQSSFVCLVNICFYRKRSGLVHIMPAILQILQSKCQNRYVRKYLIKTIFWKFFWKSSHCIILQNRFAFLVTKSVKINFESYELVFLWVISATTFRISNLMFADVILLNVWIRFVSCSFSFILFLLFYFVPTKY